MRLLEEYPETEFAAWVHEALADAFAADRMHDEAERHYREALAAYNRIPNIRGHAEIRLAELIMTTRQHEKYAEAEALVDAYEPFFKIDHFRVLTVRAKLAAEGGDYQQASTHAEEALRLSADKGPQLPPHPGVGDVRTDSETLRELRRLADSGE